MANKFNNVPIIIFSYTSVFFIVTFKLSSHTKFWSVILFIAIIFFSVALYIAYMWVSNSYFVTMMWVTNTTSMFYGIGNTFFIVLFSICFVLFVDGIVLSTDYERGGYSSRMRTLVKEEQENVR